MSMQAPSVSKELFGGILDIDGSGHYPGLELINFIVCCPDGILPSGEFVRLMRVSHDFARRLIRDDEELSSIAKGNVLIDTHSELAISRLLSCLELDIANIVKAKSWERTHFFPYTRSLVHWDARLRGEKIKLERRYLRGGGAYAFSVLRHDHDSSRLDKIRDGFSQLYPVDDNSPLERLAKTLKANGKSDEEAVIDQVEKDTRHFGDHWEEMYRNGIANILSHTRIPTVQRVRSIVNWTGIWLVLLQAGRAAQRLSRESAHLVLDCAGTHNQLRRASQRNFKEIVLSIEEATNSVTKDISAQQMGKLKGFLGNTAAACGLLNSWKGRKHFTLKVEAIESLVLAGISQGQEMEFEQFVTSWLFEELSIVTGRQAAELAGLLQLFDGTIFEENERKLAEQMKATGMLQVYSDATRMVKPGVMQ